MQTHGPKGQQLCPVLDSSKLGKLMVMLLGLVVCDSEAFEMRARGGAAVVYHPEAAEVSPRRASSECRMKEIQCCTNTKVQVTSLKEDL